MKVIVLAVFFLFSNIVYAVDDFNNSLGMTFKYIAPGTFLMGSPESEPERHSDETQHQVILTKAYFLGTTEVTQGQWQEVMGSNPSSFRVCGSNCPVENVSWEDIQEFITKMNQRGEGTYRLPTEAEWEYAARAGTTMPFSFGNNITTDQVNYNGNNPYNGAIAGENRQTPVTVGSLPANAWGLHEMHGNVWEWVEDWFGSYPSSAVTDPAGASSGLNRAIRGGGWDYDAEYCRSADRGYDSPGFSNSAVGFRLARTSSKLPLIPTAEIQSTTGQSFSITPVAAIPTTSGTIPDVGAVLTTENSTTTIKRDDGSIIEVKPETVVVLNSSVQTDNSITLILGEVTTSVDCNYEVRTALANITSCPTAQRISTFAKFTTNYSQSGLDGTLTVRVETGTVDVSDREGNVYTIAAGDEKVIQDRVPRTSWVLPINNDKIYGGYNNQFIWTDYPEADSYLIELNLPTPIFSDENSSRAEFPEQTVILTSKYYVEYDGLNILTLPLPKGADGIVIEMRLFALDSSGNIISESVSSDSTMVTVKD